MFSVASVWIFYSPVASSLKGMHFNNVAALTAKLMLKVDADKALLPKKSVL